MMTMHVIEQQLAGVVRRLRWRAALGGAVRGLAAGAMAAIALSFVHRGFAWPALVVGPLLGAMIGGWRRPALKHAAALVDAHYNLKDRAASALSFSASIEITAMQRLAIDDATTHLKHIDPRAVAPFRRSAWFFPACAMAVLAVGITFWPEAQPATAAPPIPGIVAEAEAVQDQLRDLAEAARHAGGVETAKLAEALAADAHELKRDGVDVRDALAALSAMQSALAAERARYDVAAVDAHLAQLGEAMSQHEAWSKAGDALQAGAMEDAAAAIDNFEPIGDARAVMKQASAMRQTNLSAMADVTRRFAEAARQGDRKAFDAAKTALANQVRRHAQRKQVSQAMKRQIARLNESKGACAACQGDNGKAQSDKPSATWGRGATNNPAGDVTSLDGERQPFTITGQVGEGPVEIETMRSGDRPEEATRDYREVYQEYRHRAESVLEREALPLGHRRMIRDYFESIRPRAD